MKRTFFAIAALCTVFGGFFTGCAGKKQKGPSIAVFVPGIIAGLMSLFEIYNFYSGEHRYFTEYLGIGFFGTMLGGFMLLGVGIFNFVLWMQARQPKQVGYVQM